MISIIATGYYTVYTYIYMENFDNFRVSAFDYGKTKTHHPPKELGGGFNC